MRGRDGLQLVSLRAARQRPVYLPDAGEIEESILCTDRRVLLVVAHVAEVAEPITETLRDLGVRSLRAGLKDPVRVTGEGDVVIANEETRARLGELRSNRFRRTFRKRLDKLGVQSQLVAPIGTTG